MTNKESARTIAINYDPIGTAEDAAYEMALLKDNQVKDYLNKRIDKCIALMNTLPWYRFRQHFHVHREISALFSIMNDLFED